MQRRHFCRQACFALLATGLPLNPFARMENTKHHRILPKPLRPGARISLIAPASPASDEKIEQALTNLKNLGFEVKEGVSMRKRLGHLAGTDAERLADLHNAFSDPDTDAVWCVRGGYGCTRLLPDIDFELISRHPKPFLGYSDVTALHLAIGQKTGLVTFHAPVAAGEYTFGSFRQLKEVTQNGTTPFTINKRVYEEVVADSPFEPYAIHEGVAEGELTGGNLSLLAAMCGTPWQPSFKNKLVFLEDVGEQPYRIDRLLTQLLEATDLHKAAGLALGVFYDCQPKNSDFSMSLKETLLDRLAPLGIPAWYGLPFGHIPEQVTLPYGIQAKLDSREGTLTLLERAVK
ncbi:MAG: LD-carboxypeptidase [Saprospiraceae bacterium]|nr:LD-carboxypeptidase [Saprospiraceae bacterium]